jgi:hypothetical protein
MGWKTDWLYSLLFRQVEQIWKRVRREAARDPELFGPAPASLCVQECREMDWEQVYCLPPVLREWTCSGVGMEERPPGELPQPVRTDPDGSFYRTGLVQFHIAPDRKRVGMVYVLGPHYGRGGVYRVCGQGSTGRLIAGPNGWIS